MRLVRFFLLAAVCAFVAAGCGSSSETTTKKVVQVGTEEVEIPSDTATGAFAVTRALFAKTGYEPWFAHCVLGQMEKSLTPAEAQELVKVKTAKSREHEFVLFEESSESCVQPGRDAINPKATPSELAPIRAQTAATFRSAFENEPKATHAEAVCAGRVIEQLSDEEIIELSNASPKKQEKLIGEIFLPCFPE